MGLRAGLSRLHAVAAVLLAIGAACGTAPAATPSPQATGSPPGQRLVYQLHMTFFSAETKQAKVIDPQMFAQAPGAAAARGPQNVDHAANLAPVAAEAAPDTALYDATGKPLNITLGRWKQASGESQLTCTAGKETIRSSFKGLLATGAYQLFVAHFNVNGPGRFSPAGAADGGGDAVQPVAGGAATHSTSFSPCLTPDDGLVLIWASDGQSHGATPGAIGVTQHNQLIVRAPSA